MKKMFKFLNENVKEYVFAGIKCNLLYLLIGYIIAFDVCGLIATRVNLKLGMVLIFIIFVVVPVVVLTRKASIGIGEDELMILHLKAFKVEVKKSFNIPVDKIRSITVRKIFSSVSLKISFISEEGKLEQKKYGFSTFIIGSAERREFAEKVYKKLVEIQKVIDKGDF
jgi:hypothetical protein